MRNKKRICYYCPVCGILQDVSKESWNHSFSHSLRDWQTEYDAEDFVENFLTLEGFYEKYDIRNSDTRKMLLQVGEREGVDLRSKEGTGGGTRETAIALLKRANRALGVEFVEDFTDKEGYDRKRMAIIRSRQRSNEKTRAKNRVQVSKGSLTIVSDLFHRPTRDVEEIGVIKEGEVRVGKFEIKIPYQKKAIIKLAKTMNFNYPSKVKIVWFEIFPEFQGKGLGRRCYDALESVILERYDPDELTLKTAVWDVKGYWEKMGYALIEQCSGPGKLDSMVKKFRGLTAKNST